MNSRQKIEALSAALKAGQELPNLWNIQSKPLNNLNSSSGDNLTPNRAFKLQAEHSDLNNLKRGGVPRQELYTDETLKKAMSWGVQEWLVQVCIRDYGIYKVKAAINRLYNLPEGYFKPKYGPISTQRGKLFNTEMQKLRRNTSFS